MIKKIIKGIINDFKTDIEAIKEMGKRSKEGKPIIPSHKMQQMRKELTTGWGNYFLDPKTWTFFFLLALVFTCGYFVSAKVHQNKCNTFIAEEYAPWLIDPYAPMISPFCERLAEYGQRKGIVNGSATMSFNISELGITS